jgi:hypothetical protein
LIFNDIAQATPRLFIAVWVPWALAMTLTVDFQGFLNVLTFLFAGDRYCAFMLLFTACCRGHCISRISDSQRWYAYCYSNDEMKGRFLRGFFVKSGESA